MGLFSFLLRGEVTCDQMSYWRCGECGHDGTQMSAGIDCRAEPTHALCDTQLNCSAMRWVRCRRCEPVGRARAKPADADAVGCTGCFLPLEAETSAASMARTAAAHASAFDQKLMDADARRRSYAAFVEHASRARQNCVVSSTATVTQCTTGCTAVPRC